jgi:hypothetical protein
MRLDYTYIEVIRDCDGTTIASEELPDAGSKMPEPIWDTEHFSKGEEYRGWVLSLDGDYMVFLTGGADYIRLHRADVILHVWGWNALLDGTKQPGCQKDPTCERLEKRLEHHQPASPAAADDFIGQLKESANQLNAKIADSSDVPRFILDQLGTCPDFPTALTVEDCAP